MKDIIRFARLYRPYVWEMCAGLALAFAALGAGITLLAVSGWFIAAMGLAGAAALSMNYFSPAAIIRGLSIIRTASRYGERLTNHDAALRVTATFRQRFFFALERLLPDSVRTLHSADLFDRMRADVETLERFYLNGFMPIFTALMAVIALFIVLLFYHPLLAALMPPALLLAGLLLPVVIRDISHADADRMAQAAKERRIALSELIQGMDEWLVYGQADNKIRQLQAHDALINDCQNRLHRREALSQAFTLFLTGGVLVCCLYLLLPLVQTQAFTGANLAMMALLSLAAFEIITPLPAAFQSFFAARIAARRIFEIVDRTPATAEEERQGDVLPPAAQAAFSLSLKNVSYAYQLDQGIKNISFSMQAGDITVICGPSGSGKSTIACLLAGFWKPDAGTITVNGSDISSWPRSALRDRFGFAPQKPYIFADTIRHNLLLAQPSATTADLQKACMLAGLQHVIDAKPEGLDTYVSEHGVRLSGGQIRRLSLAQALLRDAPCLVLDEPTEGLDPETEKHVMGHILAEARRRGQAVLLFLHEADQAWLPDGTRIVALNPA